MLIAGGLSVLVGVYYNAVTAIDDPQFDPLVLYAAAGGHVLHRPRRTPRAAHPQAVDVTVTSDIVARGLLPGPPDKTATGLHLAESP